MVALVGEALEWHCGIKLMIIFSNNKPNLKKKTKWRNQTNDNILCGNFMLKVR